MAQANTLQREAVGATWVGRAVSTQPCMKHPRALLHSSTLCAVTGTCRLPGTHSSPSSLGDHLDTIRTASTSYELPHHGLLSPSEAPSSSKAPGWSSDHPRRRRERLTAVLSVPHRGPCKLLRIYHAASNLRRVHMAPSWPQREVSPGRLPTPLSGVSAQTATRCHRLKDASPLPRSHRQRCAHSERMT